MNKIHPSLMSFAIPIEDLQPLPGNPRRGNVQAIMASYDEFGQVKPIVARKDAEGNNIVIAGNHQLAAARELGWDKIAVVFMDADDQRAMAFALTENRTNELGENDDALLYEALETVVDIYGDLMVDLGWDDFEIAMLDVDLNPSVSTPGVYLQPVIGEPTTTNPIEASTVPAPDGPMEKSFDAQPVAVRDSEGEVKLVAPSGVDATAAIIGGAPALDMKGSSNAIIQYSLVFEGSEQQRRWFDFVRWLRANEDVAGDTTSQRLLNYLESTIDF